jgi:collagenase-like PrtC family protease
MTPARPIELVCPAGSLPALKTAVDHGADCVYLGFKDATNARNFSGLNFDDKAIAEGVRYAHQRGRKVLLALNTYPQADNWQNWTTAVDRAAESGVDAIILADPGLMAYARKTHPRCACTCRCRARPPATTPSISTTNISEFRGRCCRGCCRWRRSSSSSPTPRSRSRSSASAACA